MFACAGKPFLRQCLHLLAVAMVAAVSHSSHVENTKLRTLSDSGETVASLMAGREATHRTVQGQNHLMQAPSRRRRSRSLARALLKLPLPLPLPLVIPLPLPVPVKVLPRSSRQASGQLLPPLPGLTTTSPNIRSMDTSPAQNASQDVSMGPVLPGTFPKPGDGILPLILPAPDTSIKVQATDKKATDTSRAQDRSQRASTPSITPGKLPHMGSSQLPSSLPERKSKGNVPESVANAQVVRAADASPTQPTSPNNSEYLRVPEFVPQFSKQAVGTNDVRQVKDSTQEWSPAGTQASPTGAAQVSGVLPQFSGLSPLDDPLEPAFRIVGGVAVDMFRYPYIASLRTNAGAHYCGGTLIAPSVILTGAHCVSMDPALYLPQVHIGRYLSEDFDGLSNFPKTLQKVERFASVERVVHPDWTLATNLHDLALLYLNGTSPVAPVKIPAVDSGDMGLQKGSSVVVLGFGSRLEGAPNAIRLQEVQLSVSDLVDCNSTFQGRIRSSQLCAGGDSNGGKDACQGDSGGPLIVKGNSPDEDVQVAVVSFGIGCARPGMPGVYTDIRKYRFWIYEQLIKSNRIPPDMLKKLQEWAASEARRNALTGSTNPTESPSSPGATTTASLLLSGSTRGSNTNTQSSPAPAVIASNGPLPEQG